MIFLYLSALSVLLPFSTGLFKVKKMAQQEKVFFIFIGVSLVMELVLFILARNRINNLPLFHVFAVVEFCFITRVYQLQINHRRFFRITCVTLPAFILFALLDAFVLEGIFSFNSYARAFSSIIIVFYAFYYSYHTLKELRVRYLHKEPFFWFNAGFFIYFSCNFILFAMSNYIVQSADYTIKETWMIHSLLNIIANTLYAAGFRHVTNRNFLNT